MSPRREKAANVDVFAGSRRDAGRDHAKLLLNALRAAVPGGQLSDY